MAEVHRHGREKVNRGGGEGGGGSGGDPPEKGGGRSVCRREVVEG